MYLRLDCEATLLVTSANAGSTKAVATDRIPGTMRPLNTSLREISEWLFRAEEALLLVTGPLMVNAEILSAERAQVKKYFIAQ